MLYLHINISGDLPIIAIKGKIHISVLPLMLTEVIYMTLNRVDGIVGGIVAPRSKELIEAIQQENEDIKLEMIAAILQGNSVMYRMVKNKDGYVSPLKNKPCYIVECEFYGDYGAGRWGRLKTWICRILNRLRIRKENSAIRLQS